MYSQVRLIIIDPLRIHPGKSSIQVEAYLLVLLIVEEVQEEDALVREMELMPLIKQMVLNRLFGEIIIMLLANRLIRI